MRKYRKFFLVPLCTIFLSFSYFLYLKETSNFHPVTVDEAYRSAQLSEAELESYINKYRIRTVLNLRGENPGKEWYDDEINISRKHGVEHYDIAHEESPPFMAGILQTF